MIIVLHLMNNNYFKTLQNCYGNNHAFTRVGDTKIDNTYNFQGRLDAFFTRFSNNRYLRLYY